MDKAVKTTIQTINVLVSRYFYSTMNGFECMYCGKQFSRATCQVTRSGKIETRYTMPAYDLLDHIQYAHIEAIAK